MASQLNFEFPSLHTIALLFSRQLNEEGVCQLNQKYVMCYLAKENVVFMLNVHILYTPMNNRHLLKYNFIKVEVIPGRNNFSSQEKQNKTLLNSEVVSWI